MPTFILSLSTPLHDYQIWSTTLSTGETT